MKHVYKTSRKYKCPFCEYKDIRTNLADHVNKKHQELIPENYTADRVIYDSINGKNYGTCMICKSHVTEWNDKINRYYNLCDNPKCRAKVREIALQRHMKVYNKPTLLNDPEQQEKMLANRRISGTYIFTDGTKMTYTGKYERSALEFMDKVLEIPAKDIQAPGPVLEYEYGGKTHKWITDIYYIPANLLIEVKDGGSNPNNRSMETYREKQVAKEEMVTNLGKFNYVRLTNNNFAQLLDVLADIKNEYISSSDDNHKMKIHINEEVGGLPPHRPPEAYVIPYGMNNTFSGYAYTDDNLDKIITVDDEGNILPLVESEFRNKFDCDKVLIYSESDSKEKINKIHEYIENRNIPHNQFYFIELLSGRKIRRAQDVFLTECFKLYDKSLEESTCKLIENAAYIGVDNGRFEDISCIKTIGNVIIYQSPNGYYAATPKNFYLASEYFSSLEDLESSEIISLMNDIYIKNSGVNNGGEIDE